jgi:hypothetical protein
MICFRLQEKGGRHLLDLFPSSGEGRETPTGSVPVFRKREEDTYWICSRLQEKGGRHLLDLFPSSGEGRETPTASVPVFRRREGDTYCVGSLRMYELCKVVISKHDRSIISNLPPENSTQIKFQQYMINALLYARKH